MNIVFMPISFDEGMAGSYRLKNLVKMLRSNGVICKNIVLRSENCKASKNNEVSFPEHHSISFFHYFLRYIFTVKYLIKFKIPGKNILYNYGYPNVQNISYIYFAKSIGYKIIFDIVEDNYSVYTFKSWWAKLRVKSSLFFFNRIGLIADAIIVVNDRLLKMIGDLEIKKKPVIKIPISIDKDEFKRTLSQNDFDIFYGGSFGKKDGLNFLLIAFDRIANKYPNARLIITGKASLYDKKSFDESLDKIRNKERVIIKGYVSREEYLSLLHRASVHCTVRINSTFANGGFPFKLGEMLCSGTPVIVTKVGEVEKYLKHNVDSFLISPESEDEIFNMIDFIFQNRDFANRIGQAGQELAMKAFSLNEQQEEIIELLKSI